MEDKKEVRAAQGMLHICTQVSAIVRVTVMEVGVRTELAAPPKIQNTSMVASAEGEVFTKLQDEITAYALSQVMDSVNAGCQAHVEKFGAKVQPGQTVLPFNDETN